MNSTMMPATVTVITATVGGVHLPTCLASVKAQTYDHVDHWVVVDGAEHEEKVKKQLDGSQTVLVLPRNTGGKAAGNYVCHRIYASVPWLVESEYVCFLDEDNAFEPEHIQKMVKAIEGRQWAHSLRAIIGQDGSRLGVDNCESLGGIRHSVLSENDFHVDTNCYLLETHLARKLTPCWDVPARPSDGRLEADRAVCLTLLRSRLYPGICRRHSVLYRVSGRPDSVSASFFQRGNAVTAFDPAKPDVYLLHFTRDATKTFLACTDHNPLSEWALTMWSGLHEHVNVLDGYVNEAIIPPGATVLATVWHPDALKQHLLKRTDIRRIVCMVESPNVRHTQQFSMKWLQTHADVVLTYWKPLLDALGPAKSVHVPMNTHCLDLDMKDHRMLGLRPNYGTGRSVGMVLEHRPRLGGSYEIDGITLTCLDPLRVTYAQGMREITCYGKGWDAVLPASKIGHTLGKMEDSRHSVDILQHHVFALIVENCDADGYVSEKVYDALMAGAVPLYFGEVPGGLGIDIRPFDDGTALQAYVDSLSDEEIRQLRAEVFEKRESVLRAVGISVYTDAFLRSYK